MSVNERFIDWLGGELEKRSWSQGELARRSGISQSQVSLLLTGNAAPGVDSIQAIAHAFNLRREDVFRIAGYLDPLPEDDRTLSELQYLIPRLTTPARERVLAYARFEDARRPTYTARDSGEAYGGDEDIVALFQRLPPEQQDAVLILLNALGDE